MNIFRGRELYLRTLIYILAVITFFSYWYVLGWGSAFVGATVVKGALVLLGTDLTGNPLRSTITFFVVFMYIGLFSFLASLNIYMGLAINFVTLFLIAYNFSSNVKQLIWRPFVLGYLYLLVEPGTYHQLPSRFLALGLGTLFVALTQFILNTNKSKKSLNDGLTTLLSEICAKIDIILDGKEVLDNKFKVVASVDKISQAIYSKRIDPFFVTKKDNTIFNIALYGERLNYLLKEININLHNNIEKSFIEDLKIVIQNISSLVNDKDYNNEILMLLTDFYTKHKDNSSNDYYLYEILQNIKMLKTSIERSAYDGFRRRDIFLNRKLKNQISSAFKFTLSRDSLKLTFAFRIAFLLSVSYFIVNYFKIPEGKWIVFTIYAVVDPLFESTKNRFPKRFKGTLLGVCIFIAIYITVQNIYLQAIIFIALYYLFVITKDFGVRTMCTAAVSLGLFAMATQSPSKGIIYRVVFVVLGILIGYLGNKYIFPYNSTKSNNKILSLYHSLSTEILDFAFNNPVNDYYFCILREKLFLSKLYESKLVSNKNEDIKAFIFNQRILNNTICFLVFSIKDSSQKDAILAQLKEYIICLDKNKNYKDVCETEILIESKKAFEDNVLKLHKNDEKLTLINLQRIAIRLNKSHYLIKKILNTQG